MFRFLATCALLSAAFFLCPSVYAAEPSLEDLALARLIADANAALALAIAEPTPGCACAITGVCTCGASCDCDVSKQLKMGGLLADSLVAFHCRKGRGGSSSAEPVQAVSYSQPVQVQQSQGYPDTIVRDGVTQYRVGSAAARAVGILDPVSIPVFTLANGRADLHPFYGWQMTGQELQSAGVCGAGGCSGGSCGTSGGRGGFFRGRR